MKKKNSYTYSFMGISWFFVFLLLPFVVLFVLNIKELYIGAILLTLLIVFLLVASTRYVEFDFDEKTLKLNTFKYKKTIKIDEIAYYISKKGKYFLYDSSDNLISYFDKSYINSFTEKYKQNIFFFLLIPEGKQEIIIEKYNYDFTKEKVEKQLKKCSTASLIVYSIFTIFHLILYSIFAFIDYNDRVYYPDGIQSYVIFIIICLLIFLPWIFSLVSKNRYAVASGACINIVYFNPVAVFFLWIIMTPTSITTDFSNYRVFDTKHEEVAEFFYDNVEESEVVSYYYINDFVIDPNCEIAIELKVDSLKFNEILSYYYDYNPQELSIKTFKYDTSFMMLEYKSFDFSESNGFIHGSGTFVLFNDETNTIIIEYLHAVDGFSIEDSFIFNRFNIV